MEISFKVDSIMLKRAMGVVSIVDPQPTPQTAGGFLFMVKQETCSVYSRDGKHEARASFPITDVVGEGPFILPAEAIEGLSYVSGEVQFLATEKAVEGSKEGAFMVKYTFGESGLVEQVSVSPRTMHMFEKDITTARETATPKAFTIKVLQFALATTKPFLPKPGDATIDKGEYRTVRVFGDEDPDLVRANANGHMLASNSKEACYFRCGEFEGKDLSIPAQHLSLVESFLSRSEGKVAVYQTETKAYMFNSYGDVLGWPRHTAEYKTFTYYAKTDEIVVNVAPADIILRLKMMRANLPKEKPKIRMRFDPGTNYISFSAVVDNKTLTSDPVAADAVSITREGPLVANVNVLHMLHLFEGVRGDKVEFRVKTVAPASEKRPKDRLNFRTIDGFLLSEEGAIVGGLVKEPPPGMQYPPKGTCECIVTRFAPGID